jgi:hypothetical protein
MCSILHSQSYKVHGYKHRMHVDLPLLSPHSKMFDLAESFACKVHKLHVEIIKHIQAINEQYKFEVDLHKYCYARRLFLDTYKT